MEGEAMEGSKEVDSKRQAREEDEGEDTPSRLSHVPLGDVLHACALSIVHTALPTPPEGADHNHLRVPPWGVRGVQDSLRGEGRREGKGGGKERQETYLLLRHVEKGPRVCHEGLVAVKHVHLGRHRLLLIGMEDAQGPKLKTCRSDGKEGSREAG